jgi:uncharacterized protein
MSSMNWSMQAWSFGIDREGIQRTLARQDYDKPIPVAAGREPVFGQAHRIQYHFNVNRGKPYLEMDFGRINLKELNFIDNRKEGELLAELVPPVAAVDGMKVTGETIPAESDSQIQQLQPGLNTLLSAGRYQAVCPVRWKCQDPQWQDNRRAGDLRKKREFRDRQHTF